MIPSQGISHKILALFSNKPIYQNYNIKVAAILQKIKNKNQILCENFHGDLIDFKASKFGITV